MTERKNERRTGGRRASDQSELSPSEIDKLASIIGSRIENKIYQEIGKVSFRIALYFAGAAGTAFIGWFHFSDKTVIAAILGVLAK